jgi:hypothetical protein
MKESRRFVLPRTSLLFQHATCLLKGSEMSVSSSSLTWALQECSIIETGRHWTRFTPPPPSHARARAPYLLIITGTQLIHTLDWIFLSIKIIRNIPVYYPRMLRPVHFVSNSHSLEAIRQMRVNAIDLCHYAYIFWLIFVEAHAHWHTFNINNIL